MPPQETYSEPRPRAAWRRPARDILLLAALVYITFVNSLTNPLVDYDDEFGVRTNPYVQGLTFEHAVHAFSLPQPGEWRRAYLPLRDLSLALDYSLGRSLAREDERALTRQLHLTNLLLHTLNTCLAYSLLIGLGLEAATALLAAALFACHPVHAESVAWISGRKDVLSAFFFLAALLAYCRSKTSGWPWRAVSLVSFVAAGLSKATTLLLPGILAAQDLIPPAGNGSVAGGWRERLGRAWKAWLPFIGVALVLGGLHLGVALRSDTVHPQELARRPSSVLISLPTMGHYLAQMLWPAHLGVRYERPQDIRIADALLPVLFLAAAMGWTCRRAAPGRQACLFLWAWCAFTLLPVLNLVPTAAWGADRYLYLPSLGAVGLLAMGLVSGIPAKRLRQAASAGVLGSFAALAVAQNIVWSDSFQLWKNAVQHAPGDAVAGYNLSIHYVRRGQPARAVALLERARSTLGDVPDILNNLGVAYLDAGHAEMAEEMFHRVLEQRPEDATARLNLGFVRLERGDLDGAEEMFRRLLAERPGSADVRRGLGRVLAARQRYAEALQWFEEAARIDPKSADLFRDYARAAREAGNLALALEAARALVRLMPRDIRAVEELARLESAQGNMEYAVQAYEFLAALQPNWAEHHFRLGHLLWRLGRAEEAMQSWRRVIALRPDHAGAKEALERLGRSPAKP
ncbi:MAG: tetratricopeptide repeat protein [Planctomycetes bacterium]|nr:tetratricopeptide repeat protein [Planctomycetota bacterium]